MLGRLDRRLILAAGLMLALGLAAGFAVGRQTAAPPAPAPSPTSTPGPAAAASATPTPPPPSPTLPAGPSPTATAVPPAAPTAARLPVLEYHHSTFSISGGQVQMTTAWFLEQMQWLADNQFVTLTADDLLAHLDGQRRLPQRSVMLTFDIGTAQAQDYREVIVPALRRHGFHAILFVLTGAITADGALNTVSWDDLRAWQAEGLVSIESHGVYHPDYRELSFGQMLWDARTAYDLIAAETGRAPVLFAFPFDSVPDNPALLMERAGYRAALAGHRAERSVRWMDPERFALPRYYPYANPAEYPLLVSVERWTFPQMMLASIAADDAPAPAAEPTPTPSTQGGAPPFGYLARYLNYCVQAGVQPDLEIDARAAFLTDVSPYAQSLLEHRVLVRPTCRFGDPIRPEAIVLHYTGGPYVSALSEFRSPASLASIHYIVDSDGTITQMVPELYGAYHVICFVRNQCLPDCPVCEDEAGRLTEPWRRTIGIEIVNSGPVRGEWPDLMYRDGTPFAGLLFIDYLASWRYRYWEDYPEAQVAALRVLVEDILARHGLPLEALLGHSRIQFSKIDPGPALNLTWTRYGDPPRPPIFTPRSGPSHPAIAVAAPAEFERLPGLD